MDASIQTTEQLIAMWIHDKSPSTSDSYQRVVSHLSQFVSKPLPQWTIRDLQLWQESLQGSGNTIKTKTAIAKSFIGYCHKLGIIPFNMAMALATPKSKDCLHERILTEVEVLTAIALETNRRDKLILKTLYYAGIRVTELVNLNWSDLTPNGDTGQVTVFGKRGKTRSTKLPPALYSELLEFRGTASNGEPIFSSRTGNRLTRFRILQIVRAAAVRAGLDPKVSPHWLRHAHASHSLDRGAPLTLVQSTLGHVSVTTTSRYLHAKPNDSSGLYLPG